MINDHSLTSGRVNLRRTAALCISVLCVATASAVTMRPAAAGTVTPEPHVVPALRQWTGASGTFTWTPSSRVVVSGPAVATLTGVATTLADDLTALTGTPVPVSTGPARPGDVDLTLGAVPAPGATADGVAEAYRLDVAATVTVTAGTPHGAFNGTRTLLQLLHQAPTIGYGTTTDWPTYAERGLLVDVGRKFLPVDWLRARIREMAYLKLDLLHLHLSDNLGFRLESDTHPEITSPEHYTKAQISELVAYAARYGVEVVPEIDFPAHCAAILAAHPELRLVDDAGTASPNLIDLSDPASYRLIEDLMREYLPLFGGRYWHIGADEYLSDYRPYPQLLAYARAHYGPTATAKDVYYGYMNWADRIVRSTGRTTRVWNDGLHGADGTVAVDPDIVVDHWSAEGPLQNPWLLGNALTAPQLVAQGHLVANDAFTPTYYTSGTEGQLLTAPVSAMYDAWNPSLFVDGTRVSDPNQDLGSMVSLWLDDPTITGDRAAVAIHDRLRVMAQQTWGSPRPAPEYYLGFTYLIALIGNAPA